MPTPANDHHPSFPLTRSLLTLAYEATPDVSPGIMFRWSEPTSFRDFSLDGEPVTQAATRIAARAFRAELLETRKTWDMLDHRPVLMQRSRMRFKGVTKEQLRKLWDRELGYSFYSLDDTHAATISSDKGQVILDVTSALKVDLKMRQAAQEGLFKLERSWGAFLPKEDLLINKDGWVLHGVRLARFCGLTAGDLEEVRATCGSIVGHLVHVDDCQLKEARLSDGAMVRIEEMGRAVRSMRSRELDETLLLILEIWHQIRDRWASNDLVVGTDHKSTPGRWLFVDDRRLMGRFFPDHAFRGSGHARARALLLPLAVLSRMPAERGVKLTFGEPLLAEALDCLDAGALAGSVAPRPWLAGLPPDRRRGFCVRLGLPVTRAAMRPFENPDGRWSWGPNAIKDAKRTDADEETVDDLEKAWKRTDGFFDYPTLVSMAGLSRKWPLSVRVLARNMVANLSTRPPLWKNDDDGHVFFLPPYWAKRYHDSKEGRLVGEFYPVLGRAKYPWAADKWLLACNHSHAPGATTVADRMKFVEDFEFLGKELGLQWRIPNHGSGKRAIDDLMSMTKNPKRWGSARITPLLPVDFLSRLKQLSVRPPKGKIRPSYWKGERIDRAMRTKGLNQASLAEAVGVSGPMISQVISEAKAVSSQLSQAFDEVLGRPGSMSRDNRVK